METSTGECSRDDHLWGQGRKRSEAVPQSQGLGRPQGGTLEQKQYGRGASELE